MSCPDCDYFTDRRDNLTRHISVEHSNKKMVESMLEEILIGVTTSVAIPCVDATAATGGDVADGVSVDEESPYLRMRNARVAEIQKEFQMLFPTFGEEVSGLRVKPKKKKKKKNANKLVTSCRKSSRVHRNIIEGEFSVNSLTEEAAGAEEMVENCPGEEDAGGSDDQVLVAEEYGRGGDIQVLAGGDHTQGADIHVLANVELGGHGPTLQEGPGEANDGAYEDHNLGKHGCLPCGLTFRDSSNLKRHVQLVHTRRSEPIHCPRSWCKEEFDVLAEMRQHKVNCMMVCPYEGCMKRFIRPEKFAAHQRSHSALARRMND